MSSSTWGNLFKPIGKLLNHTISEDEIIFGDHIYVYRAMMTFSHHGIYCGKWKDVRGPILHQINNLDKKQNLEFYQRLKQSFAFLKHPDQDAQSKQVQDPDQVQKEDKKQNASQIQDKFLNKISSPSSSTSTFSHNPSQSISDILDSAQNKKQILSSICDTFKPDDGIVIHLSGTAATGPLIQPCTLDSFINEGVGSFRFINVLKRVRYNCNIVSFYLKRSGSPMRKC